MSRSACPSLETLAAFALGKLPEPELSAVAEHLDVCSECEEQAARLDGMADAVVSELRRISGSSVGTDDDAESDAPGPGERTGTAPAAIESWGEFRIVRELGRGGMGVV